MASGFNNSEIKLKARGWTLPWLKWLGVVPFVLFLVFLIIFNPVAQNVPNLVMLNRILSAVFVLIPCLIIAYLMARTFFRMGRSFFLWMGTGIFILAFSGFASWLPANNARVTVATSIAFLASLAEVISVILAQRSNTVSTKSGRYTSAIALYGGSLLLLVIIYILALYGASPLFFSPQAGFTALRQAFYFVSGGLIGVAGAYFLFRFLKSRSSFLYWFSLGLLLAAMSFITNGFSLAPGTILTWFLSFAIYICGIYWFVAAYSAEKEARTTHMPVSEVIASFFRQTRESYQHAVAEDGVVTSDANAAARKQWSVSKWLGLVPLAFIATLTAVLAVSGARASLAPPLLFPVLQTLFIFTSYSVAAYYCARSFLRTGLWHMLLFGTGFLILGTSTTVIGWVSGLGGLNTITKIGNTGSLISSLLILFAAMLLWRSAPLAKTDGRLRVMLTTYTAGEAFVALIMLLAIWNVVMPTFYDASGPTVLRQAIFGMAAFLMAVSTVWMTFTYIRSKLDFPYWCCLGLALITISFIAGLFSAVMSDAISWLSRIIQYFSGIYLIVAGLVAGAEARKRGVALHELIADFGKQSKLPDFSVENVHYQKIESKTSCKNIS